MPSEYSQTKGGVILVVDAGSKAGYRTARELLEAGFRVAVTDRHATKLARIMHGYGCTDVLALAADLSDRDQLARVISRVESRLGPIETIVHAGEAA